MRHFANMEKRASLSWPHISSLAISLMGGFICALAALGVSALAAGRSWEAWTPLMFSSVLFLAALAFGSRAGLLGSVLSALVFTIFLFGPNGRIGLANETARMNLGWMTLTGIAFSLLFAPADSRMPRG
jgi:K+-sensing histidine kinase KdpD